MGRRQSSSSATAISENYANCSGVSHRYARADPQYPPAAPHQYAPARNASRKPNNNDSHWMEPALEPTAYRGGGGGGRVTTGGGGAGADVSSELFRNSGDSSDDVISEVLPPMYNHCYYYYYYCVSPHSCLEFIH